MLSLLTRNMVSFIILPDPVLCHRQLQTWIDVPVLLQFRLRCESSYPALCAPFLAKKLQIVRGDGHNV